MEHSYKFQEYPNEHHNDLLKEAELNRMLKGKGAKRGNGISLTKLLVSKVEDLLVFADNRLSKLHISPLGGRFKEA